MARKVKCPVTGEYGTNETFIKIGKRYYKSQQVYDDYIHEKEERALKRNAITSIILEDFMGYEQNQPAPSLINKFLKELSFYSDDVILETIKTKYDDIQYMMRNKQFTSEYGQLAYIFAIINNNISNVYKKYKHRKIVQESESVKHDSSEIIEALENVNIKHHATDLSDFI